MILRLSMMVGAALCVCACGSSSPETGSIAPDASSAGDVHAPETHDGGGVAEGGSLNVVMPLASAPQGTQIVDDGVDVYASTAQSAPFWKAPLSGTSSWTQMPDMICRSGVCRGSNQMAYDAVHHVIYSANWGAGLWRLATR